MFPKGWQFGREPKWWLEVVELCPLCGANPFCSLVLLVSTLTGFTLLLGCAARLAAGRQVFAVWGARLQRQLLASIPHVPEQGRQSLGPERRMILPSSKHDYFASRRETAYADSRSRIREMICDEI
jgi:hypothetical protein